MRYVRISVVGNIAQRGFLRLQPLCGSLKCHAICRLECNLQERNSKPKLSLSVTGGVSQTRHWRLVVVVSYGRRRPRRCYHGKDDWNSEGVDVQMSNERPSNNTPPHARLDNARIIAARRFSLPIIVNWPNGVRFTPRPVISR